jgi:hypothetical protein
MKSAKEAAIAIGEAISRQKAAFDITHSPESGARPFLLLAGSYRAAKNGRGYIISMSLSREQLQALRALCSELLGES